MDKMVLKVKKKKVSGDISSELLATSLNSLVGASSSGVQTVARDSVAQIPANSF